jgi:hypothetical protein
MDRDMLIGKENCAMLPHSGGLSMSTSIGKQAVVVGRGIAGLAGAKALSAHFDQVKVLGRDALPSVREPRSGTPQARDFHVLLVGGQEALRELFPNISSDLEIAGALQLRTGLDVVWERPGFDPVLSRDRGFGAFAMSHTLLEFVTRPLVEEQDRTTLRRRCRLRERSSPLRIVLRLPAFVSKTGKGAFRHFVRILSLMHSVAAR